jgi:hypothetical protein
MEHRESSTDQLDTTITDEQAIGSTEATSEWDATSKDDNESDDTSDSGNASDNGGHIKIGAEAVLASMSYDFGWSKVTRGRILDVKNSFHFLPKGFVRPRGVESVPVPKEKEAVGFEDFFSLLAFTYLRTLWFWIYFTNFVCNCINSHPILLCKSTSLFGMLLLVEVLLMLRIFLITMSYITRTRRFILKGPRLPSLHSLGAYLFTHLSLGIMLGLLPLHRTSGLVARVAIGSTVKCLRNKEVIFEAKGLIR